MQRAGRGIVASHARPLALPPPAQIVATWVGNELRTLFESWPSWLLHAVDCARDVVPHSTVDASARNIRLFGVLCRMRLDGSMLLLWGVLPRRQRVPMLPEACPAPTDAPTDAAADAATNADADTCADTATDTVANAPTDA